MVGALLRHEAAVQIRNLTGLDGEGGLFFNAGMSGGTLRLGGSGVLCLSYHGGGQFSRVVGGDQMAQAGEAPCLRNPVEAGSDNRAAAGMSLQHHGGESFRGDLWVHQNVESVVEGDRVGVVANEQSPACETVVPDVLGQNVGHGPGACEEKF
jgi:hypothetical protein